MKRFRMGEALLAVLLFGSCGASSWAQGLSGAPDYRVKAAYLLQFLNYVEWPPEAFGRADSPS
jgi:hypothetical protein